MSKLTDDMLNILFSRWRGKRYEKKRVDEITTSFLIKNALKDGTYLSEEYEYQSQEEHIQFRASKDHAVILGTVLDRIFDIRKEDLRMMYVIYKRMEGQVGEEITNQDTIWDFDLCKAMTDEKHLGMFYNQVTLCVSYVHDGNTDETVLIHLKENGGDEHTRFIRASIMNTFSTKEGDVSFPTTENQPDVYSILFAYDDCEPQKRIDEFEGKVKNVVDKYTKGRKLDDVETALIAKLMPEAVWHYSWGHKAFDEKQYWDALLHLETAFHLLKEQWYKDKLSIEGSQIFYHCCYLIGFCYAEMRLYEKAYFYLDFVWPLKDITYCAEYINCLVNSKDIRAMNMIDEELERLDDLKEEEFTDDISNYYCFLLRRRAYVLTDMHHLDEAEDLLKKLLEVDGRTEYIQNELDYIRQLREKQQGNS